MDNPSHGGHPFVAAVYDTLLGPFEERFRSHRLGLLRHAAGRVLELGAGTGVNFDLYDSIPGIDTPVVAIEPDPHMRSRAAERASKAGVEIDLVDARAEHLPWKSNSFDTVVGTFVMCTVGDPELALSEIERVLAPGGQYLFIEHVQSTKHWARTVQNIATPVWRHVAGGCRLNRQTVLAIEGQGFAVEVLEQFDTGSGLLPIVLGVATFRES